MRAFSEYNFIRGDLSGEITTGVNEMGRLIFVLLSVAVTVSAFANEASTAATPASICCGDGGWSHRACAVIERVIRQYLPGIENEYVATLEQEPGLAGGKITARFTLAADGSVTDVRLIEDTVGCPLFSDAVAERVHAWRFPPIVDGECYVVYPLTFINPERVDEDKAAAEPGHPVPPTTGGGYSSEEVLMEGRSTRPGPRCCANAPAATPNCGSWRRKAGSSR